jgi:outer membrane protein assembly factor BamB
MLRRLAAVIGLVAWWGAALNVAAPPAAAEENWSRFRGPNGVGVARDAVFPATWTADDYLWKIDLPGKGHSSPVGWGDLLFVTSADEVTAELTLHAIDAATGDVRWSEQFASAPQHLHGANSYASSTPAVDAERVYVTWASADGVELTALDHAGQEIWRRPLGPIEYKHGFGGSPIVVGDMVIVASDNLQASFVAACDARTGSPRWKTPRSPGAESYATPAVWRRGGAEQIIVSSTAEGLAGLSPTDGAVVWQLPEVFPARCVQSPVVADELVIGGSGEGGNGKSFVVVRPDAPPQIVFELAKSTPQVPTPVVNDDLLFVWSDRGVVSCCELDTGEVLWTKRVGGNYFGSPIVAGDKLYCISSTGECVVLAAGREYELLGRNDLGDGSHATPAVQRGRMYLRTEKSLACLPAAR